MTDLRARAWHLLCDVNEDCGDGCTTCETARGCACLDRLTAAFEAIRSEQIEADARIAEDCGKRAEEFAVEQFGKPSIEFSRYADGARGAATAIRGQEKKK